MRRVSAITIFCPFSTLHVNSGKGFKLWIQRDIENAILDGTTHVVQHLLMIQASVRASGMSSWSCVFGGYVSRWVIRCKITQYHPNLEHKTTSMLCLDCSYVSWQKLLQTPAFNPFKLNVSWWRSRRHHEHPVILLPRLWRVVLHLLSLLMSSSSGSSFEGDLWLSLASQRNS